MNAGKNRHNSLFDGGRQAWERTGDFEKRIDELKQALRDEYQVRIDNESNWFKRQIIRIQFLIEFKKRTSEISSWKNLHLNSGWT